MATVGRLRVALAVIPAMLVLNALFARRLLHAPATRSTRQRITGRIVGQPFDFAHEFLRERPSSDGSLPPSGSNESVAVAIVGGGVAGLVAAWALTRRGVDVVVLELEEAVGGNARWGEDGPDGAHYPWGAHYVPIPSRRARSLRAFFEDLDA